MPALSKACCLAYAERGLRVAENILYYICQLITQNCFPRNTLFVVPILKTLHATTQESIGVHHRLCKVFCECRLSIMINVCTCIS